MKTEVPKVEDWVEVIHNIDVMERLTFSLRLEVDKFRRLWENWIEYIKPIRSDFIGDVHCEKKPLVHRYRGLNIRFPFILFYCIRFAGNKVVIYILPCILTV